MRLYFFTHPHFFSPPPPPLSSIFLFISPLYSPPPSPLTIFILVPPPRPTPCPPLPFFLFFLITLTFLLPSQLYLSPLSPITHWQPTNTFYSCFPSPPPFFLIIILILSYLLTQIPHPTYFSSFPPLLVPFPFFFLPLIPQSPFALSYKVRIPVNLLPSTPPIILAPLHPFPKLSLCPPPPLSLFQQ
uniref:Zinc finger domain containing protein n=1 Tax=Oryza sativa subsp. japonica TaxID=39947 RepID=C6YXL3_ORYSJ|nr:zinc finger domain containing protein [Oryza sativa Japonica Group]